LRTGLVIARGGALKPLLPLVRLGLGGPLGRGIQHWPWISLHDEAAAIVHLLGSTLSGPVNLVGPAPASANDVIRAVTVALH
ncbi:epimerase, partial [Pseudomonas sp. AB12(2023)]|nr:epimerase [Pseudomonas sp. AB12(2023)]